MIYMLEKNGTTAKIDSLGARIISLKTPDGLEYIWQRDPEYWEDCAPVLFPIVGRSRGGIITVDGVDYPMPIHGVVKNAEFTLVEKSDDSVTLQICSSEETKKSYPFDFQLRLIFNLDDQQLYIDHEVVNTGEADMYFGIGAHPGFNCPLVEGETFEDYELVFDTDKPLYANCIAPDEAICATEKKLITTGSQPVPLSHDLFVPDALIFEDIPCGSVQLVSKKSGRGVEVEFSEFPSLGIWTRPAPSDAPYVCIEPWRSMGFRDNEGTDLKQRHFIFCLEAGWLFTGSYSIRLL